MYIKRKKFSSVLNVGGKLFDGAKNTPAGKEFWSSVVKSKNIPKGRVIGTTDNPSLRKQLRQQAHTIGTPNPNSPVQKKLGQDYYNSLLKK